MKQTEESIIDDIHHLFEMTGPPLFIQEQLKARPKTMTLSQPEPPRYLNRQERRAQAAKQRRKRAVPSKEKRVKVPLVGGGWWYL